MKKKFKLFGFIVSMAIIGFTMASCDLFGSPEFPREFRGTWQRDGISNTLTITSTTYSLSHQAGVWTLTDVSGDVFTMFYGTNRNWTGFETIRYVNGNLEIEPCRGTGLDNCGGTWRRIR